MSVLFIITLVLIFLTVLVESISLTLQLKGQKLTRWFGRNAFAIHMILTGFLWTVTFCLIVLLQFKEQPIFHTSNLLKYMGLILLITGIILSSWGFAVLGLKRSFCLNFFKENVPVVNKSLYKFIKNPEDYGFWLALAGLAFFTQSSYNLTIAIEFIIIMIPHSVLESVPLKKKVRRGKYFPFKKTVS